MPRFRNIGPDGVVEIFPDKFGDDRGFFSETHNQKVFQDHGIDAVFVQDNHSYSASPGVLRGLHFQVPPFGQDKLVRVVRGSVFDVVVDIRKGSPTFGEWAGLEISAREWNQLFIPQGFAHGFVTLEPDTEFLYKVSAVYSREHERAIRFDDPDIGIKWPVDPTAIILSDKDRMAPLLRDIDTGFHYQPNESP